MVFILLCSSFTKTQQENISFEEISKDVKMMSFGKKSNVTSLQSKINASDKSIGCKLEKATTSFSIRFDDTTVYAPVLSKINFEKLPENGGNLKCKLILVKEDGHIIQYLIKSFKVVKK